MRISDWSSDVCSSDLATNLPVAGPDDYGQRTQPRYHVALAFRIAPEDAPDGMFITAEAPVHSIRSGSDEEGPLLIVLGPHFDTGQQGDVAGQFRLPERWARPGFAVCDAAWGWARK